MGLGDFGYGSGVGMDAFLARARDNISEWQGELQKKIEKWCRENGYQPADATAALSLVDELKSRGVKSFEGLGIKVTL